jgi:hypothetical protein
LLIRHIIDNNIDYPKDHKRILFYQTMRNAQSHMNIFDNMPKVGSQQLYGRYWCFHFLEDHAYGVSILRTVMISLMLAWWFEVFLKIDAQYWTVILLERYYLTKLLFLNNIPKLFLLLFYNPLVFKKMIFGNLEFGCEIKKFCLRYCFHQKLNLDSFKRFVIERAD